MHMPYPCPCLMSSDRDLMAKVFAKVGEALYETMVGLEVSGKHTVINNDDSSYMVLSEISDWLTLLVVTVTEDPQITWVNFDGPDVLSELICAAQRCLKSGEEKRNGQG